MVQRMGCPGRDAVWLQPEVSSTMPTRGLGSAQETRPSPDCKIGKARHLPEFMRLGVLLIPGKKRKRVLEDEDAQSGEGMDTPAVPITEAEVGTETMEAEGVFFTAARGAPQEHSISLNLGALASTIHLASGSGPCCLEPVPASCYFILYAREDLDIYHHQWPASDVVHRLARHL